ncbi:anti-sigma factor [Nocardioides sp.]|uniref:anti-sigma factor n=1 Tax=Nocardioides sp. TaxID=35761 RepID=UPI0039E5D07F
MTHDTHDRSRADAELRLPADGAFVAVLRTATTGLAARLDFTLDDLEDLRIAVGEAAALVLESAQPDADLTARFWLRPGMLTVAVGAAAAAPRHPDPASFAWTVLTTLAAEVSARAESGVLEVTLTAVSELAAASATGGRPRT